MSNRVDYLLEQISKLPEDDIRKLEDHVLGLAGDNATKMASEYELVPMADYREQIEELEANWGKMQGLSTGLPTLDKMTMGLVGGEMIVVAGATSNGKTALAVNITAEIAKRKRNVAFVTLEMTKPQLGSRLKHIMGQEAFDDAQMNVFFQKKDELNWKSIDGLMHKAIVECGCEVIVIDHLHYFTRELKNVAEDLGNITKEFKKNAIRHNVPVILISHTRKSSKSHDNNTGINDLRGSSYIAQDADIVLMVQRDQDLPTKILVRLEKNRNRYGCDIGTEKFFNFDATKITEIPTGLTTPGVSVMPAKPLVLPATAEPEEQILVNGQLF